MGKFSQTKGRRTELEGDNALDSMAGALQGKGGVNMALTEEQKQRAKETRAKNNAVRAAQRGADAELKQAARRALQQVFEAEDATVDQTLRAAELLVKLSCH